TCTVMVLAPLFFAEIFLSRLVQDDERKLAILEKIAGEGNSYSSRFDQLAVRIYQMSAQDPVLKDVLTLHQINVTKTVMNPAGATAPSSSSTKVVTPPPK
ncbi:MAG TPA: hypothetical protein VL981_01730, partial [Candidatus Methylacidiphilales bacterium]|nr:hypothetical protein [Candidatus Methylacidiphilales bacterium]